MKNEYQAGDLVCLKNARTQEVFTVKGSVAIEGLKGGVLCEGYRSFWPHELEPKPIQVGDKVRCLSDSKIYKVTHDHMDTLNLVCEENCHRILFSLKSDYRAISAQAAVDAQEASTRRKVNSSPLSRKLAEIRAELDKVEAEPRGVGSTVYPIIDGAHDKIRALLNLAESLVEINLTEAHDDPDKGIYETLNSVMNLRGDRWDDFG